MLCFISTLITTSAANGLWTILHSLTSCLDMKNTLGQEVYPQTQSKELRLGPLLLEGTHALHGVGHHGDSSWSHLPAAPGIYQSWVPIQQIRRCQQFVPILTGITMLVFLLFFCFSHSVSINYLLKQLDITGNSHCSVKIGVAFYTLVAIKLKLQHISGTSTRASS